MDIVKLCFKRIEKVSCLNIKIIENKNEPPCGKTAGYQKQNSLRRFLSFLPRIKARDKLQQSLPHT
jgi:hypothetical protein